MEASTSQSSLRSATPDQDFYYQHIWNDAFESCRATLGDDFDVVSECESCEKLVEHLKELCEDYKNTETAKILKSLRHNLAPFQKLTHACAFAMRGYFVRTGIIWGLVNFLIEASIQSEKVLSLVVEMLQDISHHLSLLLNYQSQADLSEDVERALVEVFIDIITFGAYIAKFLRKHSLEVAFKAWSGGVAKELEKTSSKIQKQFQRIKEKAFASYVLQPRNFQSPTRAELIRDMNIVRPLVEQPDLSASDVLPKSDSQQTFKLRHHIPLKQNPNFFGRNDILSQIQKELGCENHPKTQRTLAIWGTAGIGKSQIALSYAWSRLAAKLPAVFWVNCETEIDIAQSFSKIASALDLEGAALDGNDENNRNLVTKWLQTSNIDWLLVFDNVEDIDMVRDCWQESPRGSVLITSRREVVAMEIESMEIPVFNNQQGSSFLQTLVGRKTYSTEEQDAAVEMSQLLGGLPLGIALMAMQIRRTRENIHQFLQFYKEHWSRLREVSGEVLKPYYKCGLDTAWLISFEFLEKDSPQATALFGTLCMLAPEDIPTEIFRPAIEDSLPESLKFCSYSWSQSIAIEVLHSIALIRREPETNTFSVHRLIQVEYRNRLTPTLQRAYFKSTAKLLFEAFPKLGNDLSLRDHWGRCKKYVSHVIAFAAFYEEFGLQVEYSNEYVDFAECLSSCAWYLFESGSWYQCSKVLRIGFMGIIAGTRNRTKEAYDLFEETRIIRSALLPPDHEHLANTYNNLGNELLSAGRYGEALDYYFKAINIDTKNKRRQTLHIRHLNIGSVYMFQGKFREAREQIQIGQELAAKELETSANYYDEVAAWDIANIHYREGSLTEARRWYEKAWTVSLMDNPLHPITGATLFKMACVDVKQGKPDGAIVLLRQALRLAEYNESTQGDKGDIARVLRRMAEALYQKNETEEAKKLHQQAESIRKEIQGSQYSLSTDTEDIYDKLCFDETLLGFVGSGIYASVWRIFGTDTVVKTPTDIALQQHISEKRAYERLGKHASILKYYGEVEIITKFSRKRALKLQYCPAGTLLEYFSTPGPSKQEGIAQSWMIQITDALDHVHSSGIVHGDIGAENIMISSEERLILIDFGGSSIDGSPCFAFPSARYRRIPSWLESSYEPEKKDDIFALGIVLYEISIGSRAYLGVEPDKVLQLMTNGLLPDLELVPWEGLRAIIDRCWKGTYHSVKELREELRKCFPLEDSAENKFLAKEEE